MSGFRDLILQGGTLTDVFVPAAVLLTFGVVFTALAAWRFRLDDSKVYWGWPW